MVRLAGQLFELARLEYGGVKPDKECFSLVELVQDVFQKFELAAEARELHLTADYSPELPAVQADLGMIERLLTNLLDNAVRHTPQGGSVQVQLRHRGGKVSVQVADTGPGVAPELREGLFSRSSMMGQPQRLGRGRVGLVVVQRILQLHDSEIRLLEQDKGGAAFGFSLATSASISAPSLT